MPPINKNNYDDMKQRDILVQVATRQEGIIDSLKDLKKEDVRIHDNIGKVNDRIGAIDKLCEQRTSNVHKRVDKIRWWSVGSGGIGGFLGALLAYLTGGRQ